MIALIAGSPHFFAALGSISYVLCFPKWNLIFFAPFAMTFFLFAIEKLSTKKSALWCAFLLSYAINFGGFYWITHLCQHFGNFPLWLSLLVQLLFGLVVSPQSYLFFFGARKFKSRVEALPIFLRPIFWAGFYTIAEFLARKVKIFPENLGNTLFEFLPLAQVASIGGVTLLTFLPLWWGAAFYYSLRDPKKTPALLVLPTAVIFLASGWGFFEIQRIEAKPAEVFKFGFVQHNQEGRRQAQSFNDWSSPIRTIIADLLAQTDQLLKTNQGKIDLILWPETAYPIEFPTDSDGSYSPYVFKYAELVSNSVKNWKIPLLFGGYEMRHNVVYNSAIFLDNEAKPQTSYRKKILLIFGETIPFQSVFPFLSKLLPDSGGFGAGPGAIPVSLTLRGKKIMTGMNICYEEIIPEYIRELASGGIHLFINLTKDSWYGDTAEPWQHFQLSALRAIEFRKPFVRLTDSGLSGTVSPAGRVKLISNPYEMAQTVLDVPISFDDTSTFYARWGDWFVALLYSLLAVMIWNPFEKNKREQI